MRTFILLILSVLSVHTYGQSCSGYYFLTNGETEMTIYGKNNKVTGKVNYLITDASSNGTAGKAIFQSTVTDEKGKTVSGGKGTIKCENGLLYIDAKNTVPQEQMNAYKDMEVKAEEVYIEYPYQMTDGQKLKDVSYTMDIINKGTPFSKVSMDMTNRTVVAKESVTTPAGTWDCWKITYDGRFKATMAGIGIPVNFKITEWFAPGVGVIKSESANKNGKLGSTMMLTAIKK